MRLAQTFLRLVDPASAYMRSRRPWRPRGRVFRGGAVFGPGVEGGARQITAEELGEIRDRAATERAHAERRHIAGELIDPDALRAAVRELVDQGETTWGRGSTGFTARVVTFWHGDAVLDIRVTSPSGGGSTLCRVTRRHGACNEQALADCIRTALSTA